jgi:phosphoglycerate dehydrogenase-like enzyme
VVHENRYSDHTFEGFIMPVVVMFLPAARVAATGVPLPPDWRIRHLETADESEIIADCRDADAILSVGAVAQITARIIDACEHLKFIQCLGAGFNQVDLPAAEARRIPVANSPGQNATTVAEFTIGCIIAVQRRLVESDAAIKAGRYTAFRSEVLDEGLREIAGSRLGLIGLGNIGRAVARIAGSLGASVCYHSPQRQPTIIEREFNATYLSLDRLLAECDIVSLHVPLDGTTRGMIGTRELASMKKGGILVNTSRGAVVDQHALAGALENGRPAGAAIDTFDPEPPGAGHPLLSLSPAASRRLLATPHIAGLTAPSFRRLFAASVANVERVLSGQPPENQVNRTKERVP